MPSVSNIKAGSPAHAPAAAAPSIEAAPATKPAAPTSRFGKVTITDERNATVVDNRGRRITVKKLSALDRVRLFRALGAIDSENRMLGSYASTAAAVTELDGLPVPFPSTSLQLDALIGRLDEDGLEAVILALLALSPKTEDVAAEAKGF
jgi:hypothetical protein